jgi:hypothetical protein
MIEAVSPKEINRRKFLTLCGTGTLAGLLAACQAGVSQTSNTTPSAAASKTPSPTPPPTRQPSPTDADWSALARALQGTLVRPGSPQYPTARQLFSTRFDNILPAAIAYCASPTDVQTCLAFVRRFGIPFAPSSGGHSYAG